MENSPLAEFPLPRDGIGDVPIWIQLPHGLKPPQASLESRPGVHSHAFGLRRGFIRHREQHMGAAIPAAAKQLQAAIGAYFDIGFQGFIPQE